VKLTWLAGGSGQCNDSKTCPTLYATDRGTLIVQGYVVTDSQALADLKLPAGETAVEIPVSLLEGMPDVAIRS
jgi:hypothetical protein